MTPFSRIHWQKMVEDVGVVTMEILEQENCANAELMFLAALTVLMQSFVDEFNLPEGPTPVTPAKPEMVLMKVKEDETIDVFVGS